MPKFGGVFWWLVFVALIIWETIKGIFVAPFEAARMARARTEDLTQVDRGMVERSRKAIESGDLGEPIDEVIARTALGMTPDELSAKFTNLAAGIDILKANCPPELCDKVEKLIDLVKRMFFLTASDSAREFAALGLTIEQFDTLCKLVHNAGDFQRTGEDTKTQKALRWIADTKIVRWIIAKWIG